MKNNTTKISTWCDAYLIGHEKIDKEHKRLFEIANEVFIVENDTKKLKELVKELIKYTKFHFANEENYMRSINFKNLEEHKTIHRIIVGDLENLIKKIDHLEHNQILERLQIFVVESLVKHILIEDKKVHHFRRDKYELRSIFKWKDEYKIDQDIIDDEHRRLFTIAQKAISYNGNQPKKIIKETIADLFDYMQRHFHDEELFMKEINYPQIQEHKQLHETIIQQMNQFIKSLAHMGVNEFERTLIMYMDLWLVNHIVYEDKKIVTFLENKN